MEQKKTDIDVYENPENLEIITIYGWDETGSDARIEVYKNEIHSLVSKILATIGETRFNPPEIKDLSGEIQFIDEN